MYPISEEVKALFDAGHRKVLNITGTDKNGAYIVITDDDVIENSFQIDRYCCNGEKLEIGTAIAAQLDFTLENSDGQYDGIVFEDAELFVAVGIADWTQANPVVNWVPCGYFTSDEQLIKRSTINITALDRMSRFDVVVDGTDLIFPTTVAGLVEQSCGACGVTLAQSIRALPNASVSIAELPTVNGTLTYRSLIQWCAGIMATNAWFDWYGQLHFSWYSNMTNYVSDMDNRVTSDMYENDMIVTGVEYTNDAGIPIVEGTDDYDLDLTGNAIAGPLIATVLPAINNQVNGFTYRPFTASAFSAPYLWPMDLVTFTDSEGNAHSSVLTNVAFGLNGATALESKGMTYVRNKAKYPKGFTREQAQLVKEAMTRVEDDIDKSLTQEEIFNRLTDNGAAQGIVLYNGQLYVNASYIQSGTLVLGGLNNQNGTLRVLNAEGQEIGTWTKDGISIRRGDINLDSTGSIKVGFNAEDTKYVLFDNNGMQLVLDNRSKVYTGSLTFGGGNPHYPQGTAMGMLSSSYKEGSDVWDTTFGPAYLDLFHQESGGGSYALQFNLGQFYVSGPSGVFRVDLDNGEVYVSGLSIRLANPLSIGNGGTGATTAALIVTNQYVSIEEAINEVRESRVFPISLQKNGTRYYGDMPSGYEQAEWNMELVGDSTRLTAFLFVYGQAAVYKRDFYDGSWNGSWQQIAPITPANIGAVSKSGDTMTGPLTLPTLEVKSDLPYIDFGKRGTDYTSRIIEWNPGELSINEVVTIKNGASPKPLPVNNGGTGANTKEGALTNLFYDNQELDAQYLASLKAGWVGGNIPLPLHPRFGGTGANNAAGAISNLFDVSFNFTYSYPTQPGIYHTSTDIFANLNPSSVYGILIILGRAYAAHIFIDAFSNMYVGYSGDTFGEPGTWRKCT